MADEEPGALAIYEEAPVKLNPAQLRALHHLFKGSLSFQEWIFLSTFITKLKFVSDQYIADLDQIYIDCPLAIIHWPLSIVHWPLISQFFTCPQSLQCSYSLRNSEFRYIQVESTSTFRKSTWHAYGGTYSIQRYSIGTNRSMSQRHVGGYQKQGLIKHDLEVEVEKIMEKYLQKLNYTTFALPNH